jgi:hypothetical protein
MNKLIPLLFTVILILGSIGVIAFPLKTNFIQLQSTEFAISKPTFETVQGFIEISLEEAKSNIQISGKPQLPVITKAFKYPLGTKIIDVSISYDVNMHYLSEKIKPNPKPVPLLPYFSMDYNFVMDKNVYLSTDLYPEKPYEISKNIGLKNGNPHLILTIRIVPQYSPANNVIYIPDGIVNVQVSFLQPSKSYFSGEEEYELLIITPQKFSEKLERLVTHKNNMGVKTLIKTTEQIYNQYVQGRDEPEKIKLCIHDMKETYNISYVLLAGGRKGQTFDWYIPERLSNNDDGWEAGYACDLYYADIYKIENDQLVFEDWDSNGNGIFAEWSYIKQQRDEPDYYPDVYVGRIPFRYIFEIDPVIDKIISYETTAKGQWFNNVLAVSGDTFPPCMDKWGVIKYGIYEGEMTTNITVGIMENAGFNVDKYYLSIPGVWTGRQDVVDAINTGYGFVHLSGHGNPASWGSHPPDDEVHIFIDGLVLRDVPKLKNGNKMPIVVVGGCHNAQFNVTLMNFPKDLLKYGFAGYFISRPFRFFYMEWVPVDICSFLVLQRNGGAIATIGNSGLGYGLINEEATDSESGWMEPRFFDAYANKNLKILGKAFGQTIVDYLDIINYVHFDQFERKTIETWTLIGDPSLKIL